MRIPLLRSAAAFVTRAEHHLAPTAGPRAFGGVASAVRIALGALIVHQQLNDIGMAAVAGASAGEVVDRATVQFALGGAIAVGFLTPLALLALIPAVTLYSNVYTLGQFVEVILAWGLLFAGAGRRYSVDAWLARVPVVRWAVRLGGEPSAAGVARLRLALLVLFWGVCLSAMSFHVADRLWLRGHCLPAVLTLPFMCDHYEFFGRFRATAPGLFGALLAVALFVQAVWELFLVPLLASRRGTALVRLQGWAFFLSSMFLMNLGYLPGFELLLWALVFVNGRRAPAADPDGAPPHPARPHLTAFAGACAFVVAACQVLNPFWYEPISPEWAERQKEWTFYGGWYPRWCHDHAYRYFGQGYVNVLNEDDVRALGRAHFVVCEVDQFGAPVRVVPYLDLEGGRLSYLRDDLVYFGHALPWQRAQWPPFEGDEDDRPTAFTLDTFYKVAVLDAAHQHEPRIHLYTAYLFRRDLSYPESGAPVWGPAQFVGTLPVTAIDPAEARSQSGPWGTFKLPPGHAWQQHRTTRTLAALISLHAAGPSALGDRQQPP